MAKPLKVYLDTSVPNAFFDDKNLIRQLITKEFWPRIDGHRVFVSDVVMEEIQAVPEEDKKQGLLSLIKDFECLSSDNSEIEELAKEYVIRGVIPPKYFEDAVHVAVVTVNSLDVLISWNFEHIVKLKTKREINVINVLKGYSQIEIIDPEMF